MSKNRFGWWVLALAILVGCGDNIHLGDGKIVATPKSGLTTTEGGGQATFTVVLDSRPLADVTVALESDNAREGTVSPSTLTFTKDNFNAPQVVTITGVQDDVADGTADYKIVVAAAVSDDKRFDGMKGDDVAVENIDDDTAGIRVTPVTGLTTTEAGGLATFTVVLNSKPTADVTVGLSSNDVGEGTVSPASVMFTVDNWNAPQTVTVHGVDDSVADGAQTFKVLTGAATSTDGGYAGLDADDVNVSNTDDDTAGITVTPVTGLVTTEAGGPATFTVVLSSEPTADVTIAVSSNDTSEGVVDVSTLTFTAANWNAPQTVTVTGMDDSVADGNQVYTVATAAATSTDGGYSGLDANDVSLTNTDNDSAGVTLSKTSGLVTSEGGNQDTFTIVLNSQPTANVTIPLSSNDTGEGTISPTSVTFTPANWNAPQQIRLTGVDDQIADGSQPYSIQTAPATSGDAGYNGLDAPDASATNTDNDSAGFIVEQTTGLVTTEGGGQATFTIVLTSQPTANVTVPLASSDTGEGTVSPASVTFTPTNWSAPQTVTVSGVNDDVADGNQLYTIETQLASSGDTGYSGADAPDVSVTNTDNDSPGITVSKASITTNEAGGQDTFTVVLNSQPTANVTIALSSNDTTEGSVSPASLTFTPTNWNAQQLVTVTGVNDFVQDGNQVYTIVTAPATSADSNYQNRNAADVFATNVDNDSAGIIVTPTGGLITSEAPGGEATFTIVLASQPTASVTIGLTSSDTTEGTVAIPSVTFTTANWSAPQTVTVTGVDDFVQDGNQVYKVFTSVAASADGNYNGLDPDDVVLTNRDNDTAGIIVNPTSGVTTTEAPGGDATFSIVLQSQPTSDVTISLGTSDPTEGQPTPLSVTFTPVNWNAPRVITVTGVDDNVADGNQQFLITTGAATSADPAYNGIDAADVTVTNVDNDSPGIRVTPTSGLQTNESGGFATFDVVLESQPQANVTITLSSSDPSEGTIDKTTLTFTPANWSSPQTVKVTGVDDNTPDGNQPYTIALAAATSSDPGYDGKDPPDVLVTNIDNDSAGVIVTPTSGLVTSEAGDTALFTVVLTSQPSADVTITLASSNTAEGTVGPTTLTFTPASWNVQQAVTVMGVDDSITDGNQPYTIITSTTSSTDSAFDGLLVDDVSVTNLDNDIAGITLVPTGGLQTSEFGDIDTFTIVLNAAPTADVTIGLSVSDTTEATLGAVTSVTFTPLNWNVAQTVTVTGLDDLLADGTQPYFIITAPAVSLDPNYNGMNAPDIDATNFDNDTPGVYIKARRLLRTSESGQNTFFRISLTTQPTANVTCTFSSSDTTEGTVSPTTVTFTPTNFNILQTVNIFGVDDTIKDLDQPYTIITAPCTSTDATYNGIDPRDVSVINRDND